MKQLINKWLLIITFIAMLGVAVFLNGSGNPENDTVCIVINAAMFIIVGIIYAWAILGSLKKINEMSADLRAATAKIRSDYDAENKYLWDKYKTRGETGLFAQDNLVKAYQDYLSEMRRLENLSTSGYRCSIEDYINQEMINKTAKKNMLNLIPGTMTGMGILGTFIGLSLGLQEFNTGTSAEIESSIAPLMNGIKVAFHTSIYGMVFSLVFNFVFKSVLEDAYMNLDRFIEAYFSYVCPDAENDSFSRFLDAQQKQSEVVVDPLLKAIQTMNDNLTDMLNLNREQYEAFQKMPESVGVKIDEIITPQFAKMNNSLETFADKISQTQLLGMGELVDRFVSQMNESLTGSFKNLAEVIEETSELQKKNSDYMQNILSRIGDMALNIQQINELSSKTIQSFSEYMQEVENLQTIINQNFTNLNLQMEQNNRIVAKQQEYIEALVDYERRIGEASEKFGRDMASQIALLEKMEKEISDSTKENLEIISNKALEYSESLTETAREQLQRVLSMTDDFMERLSKQIDLIVKQAEAQNTAIAEAAQQEIQKILGVASAASGDMDRASQELSRVCQQLNGQLQQALSATFDTFDQELSEITRHLSGTISEIDNTTERVPKVVASAYEEMGKSFEEMQKEMQSMIHMLDITKRNMSVLTDIISNNG